MSLLDAIEEEETKKAPSVPAGSLLSTLEQAPSQPTAQTPPINPSASGTPARFLTRAEQIEQARQKLPELPGGVETVGKEFSGGLGDIAEGVTGEGELKVLLGLLRILGSPAAGLGAAAAKKREELGARQGRTGEELLGPRETVLEAPLLAQERQLPTPEVRAAMNRKAALHTGFGVEVGAPDPLLKAGKGIAKTRHALFWLHHQDF